MTAPDDLNGFAAEYVLGTLPSADRQEANRLRVEDKDFDTAVCYWEDHLAPLHILYRDAAPSVDLLPHIEKHLETQAFIAAAPRRPLGKTISTNGPWLAIAASLALFLLFGFALWPRQAALPDKIALLQSDTGKPVFLIGWNDKASRLTVRSLAAPAPVGKSYELWLITSNAPAPRSLGVIPFQQDVSIALPADDRAALGNAVFAVSVEPQGGSPSGSATGPVIVTGKLL